MAHEPLHRDHTNSNKEELIANSIDTLVYGQFLLESPSLATTGTELARRQNTEHMARLNTRDANGKLRLLTAAGDNVYPGGDVTLPYYAAIFEPFGDSTPGNGVLKGMVRKVVGSGVTLPTKVNFDGATVNLLDTRQKVFTAAQLVRLATILKLDTSGSSTTTTAEALPEATGAEQQQPV